MTYRGWDTSKDFIEKVVREQGPFDGVMGFSQVQISLERSHALKNHVPKQLLTHADTHAQNHRSVYTFKQSCLPGKALTHSLFQCPLYADVACASYHCVSCCYCREALVHLQLQPCRGLE